MAQSSNWRKPMIGMNISLSESMKGFVDAQVKEGGYSTSSEYVRELIRKDQIHKDEQRLAALIIEGLESGPSIAVDDKWWAKKRRKLTKRSRS
jgi:antitoxin ParD1/3/4